MDVSSEYIKMCDCDEIQKLQPNDDMRHGFWELALNEYRNVWLPRQDELQEMVGDEPVRLFNEFIRWFRWEAANTDLTKFDGSMEQLWLAFAMKENHNKTWNGNSWI